MFICPVKNEHVGVRNAHVGSPILGKIPSKTQINHDYNLLQIIRSILHLMMVRTESDVEYHAQPIRPTEAALEWINFPRTQPQLYRLTVVNHDPYHRLMRPDFSSDFVKSVEKSSFTGSRFWPHVA